MLFELFPIWAIVKKKKKRVPIALMASKRGTFKWRPSLAGEREGEAKQRTFSHKDTLHV